MCCPQLDRCCCCCPVKIGTIVVGIADTVISVGILSASITQMNDESIPLDGADTIDNTHIVNVVIAGIFVAMSLLLLLGGLIGSRLLMWPWMIYSYVFITAYFINVIIQAIQYIADEHVGKAVGWIISAFINIFLQYYFFLVVFSYYRKLKSNDPPTPSGPNFARGGQV